MLEEETELWMESVWASMSDQLRNKVVAAVDSGLAATDDPEQGSDAVIRGLSGAPLVEARDLADDPGVFAEVPFGKHDIRIAEGEHGNFRVKEDLKAFVLVRVLL